MTRAALVTGGTRGIGAAIARALREAGCDVTVTGTAPTGRAPAGCAYLAADFADAAQVARLAAQAADTGVSVLVNNAGINIIGPVEEYGVADFARLQQVNVAAPFALCRAVVPGMRTQRFGRIVNITSIFSVVSRRGRAAYSASKCALVGLTRALALEVAADNILVNCLAPGFVETDMTRRILGPQGMAETVERIPMGRFAQAEEIAAYVRFLASEANTYMTGQNLVVDGGLTCE
jgi:3-oxoacyl-[acyl-carrier protein] reductase